MILATATPADAARLTRFVNTAFRGEASRRGWTTEATLLEGGERIDEAGLLEMLTAPQAAILLCLGAAGELLGSFHVQAEAGRLHLAMLAVAPASQGQGVGRFLLRAAEDYGVRHGCTVSKMLVLSARPELLAYYGRRGYRPTGATKPFPADPRLGTPKQPLTLLVLEKPLGLE